jgi:hypothetical protein
MRVARTAQSSARAASSVQSSVATSGSGPFHTRTPNSSALFLAQTKRDCESVGCPQRENACVQVRAKLYFELLQWKGDPQCRILLLALYCSSYHPGQRHDETGETFDRK